jgi:hypothetical protein
LNGVVFSQIRCGEAGAMLACSITPGHTEQSDGFLPKTRWVEMANIEIYRKAAETVVSSDEVESAFVIYRELQETAQRSGEDETVDIVYLLDILSDELKVSPLKAIALARRIVAFYNTLAVDAELLFLVQNEWEQLFPAIYQAVAEAPLPAPQTDGEEANEEFDAEKLRERIQSADWQ